MALLNQKIEIMSVNIGEKLVPVLENSLIPAFEGAMPLINDLTKAIDYFGEAIDRAATGYAILKDESHWKEISAAFNERQAAREWSRNFQELQEWEGRQTITPNQDPFGISKNPLLTKKPPFSSYVPPTNPTPEELITRGSSINDARVRGREMRANILENMVAKGGLTAKQAMGMSMGVTINIQKMEVTDGKDFAVKAREEFMRNQRNSRRALGYPDIT